MTIKLTNWPPFYHRSRSNLPNRSSLQMSSLKTAFPLPPSISYLPAEPVFVNLLRSPGIDSQPGGPVPYLTYRPARVRSLEKSIPWNRFLGPLNVYKFGLWFLFNVTRKRLFTVLYTELYVLEVDIIQWFRLTRCHDTGNQVHGG